MPITKNNAAAGEFKGVLSGMRLIFKFAALGKAFRNPHLLFDRRGRRVARPSLPNSARIWNGTIDSFFFRMGYWKGRGREFQKGPPLEFALPD